MLECGPVSPGSVTDPGEAASYQTTSSQSSSEKVKLKKRVNITSVKKEKVKCRICGKEFSCKYYHRAHELSHTGRSPYQCEVCLKNFSQKGHLDAHLRKHTKIKPYRCHTCNQSFSQLGSLKRHQLSESTVKPHECKVCHKRFSLKYYLQKHQRTHSGKKLHKCHLCNKAFGWKWCLQYHLRRHLQVKPYPCPVCPKKFSGRGNLKSHMLSHTGERPYQCEICLREFSRKGNLKMHVHSHYRERPYKCNMCDESFVKKSTLNEHVLQHNVSPQQRQACEVDQSRNREVDSGLRESVKGNSEVHLDSEHPYKCSMCEESFAEEDALNEHMLQHRKSAEQHATCEDDLQQSLNKSSDKTLKHCDKCTSGFCTHSKEEKEQVDTNLLSNNRPYQCAFCKQTFIYKGRLRIHLVSHGEKNYQCSECPRSFHHEGHLRTHTLIVHKGASQQQG